ncbi:ribonuclease E inhibitor RraB [uncultured Alistipes sp.]|nr:ribonuclease E inhibitor RraB [uncultured Alistipes sp.]
MNISRLDNTVWFDVNECVWELITLAEEHGGMYDGWGCPVVK